PHLTTEEKDLRRRLRAHGRQLGDQLNNDQTQSMNILVEAVAYEHWHRMLFARFLAENNLLMYPDPNDPVPVTLEECEELAADEGAANGWELAARFATLMLPQIFRPDSPVFQLNLPPEHQQKLERLATDLPKEVFTASDSLGWVYQFWQAKRKEEVNNSEVKIGAQELPAVTQLFTEAYMVDFLLDNSLGAWWASRRLTEADCRSAASEAELREKAAIPGVPLKYLRFVRTSSTSSLEAVWSPAAGTFPSWPERLTDLKMLDPCCGSGHFLVAALLMLTPMRMELEGLSAREAVDAVLRDNLHGLEIDRRCVELAAFALALAAWTYPGTGGYHVLPELNIACSGVEIKAEEKDWLALAGDDGSLRLALDELYKQFKDAPVLGSLINPKENLDLDTDSLFGLKWEDVDPLLAKALADKNNDEKIEMGVVAKGSAKAAEILSSKYHWIATNVPYLARGKQCENLRDFCEEYYPAAKNDLATVFLGRCLDLCEEHGAACIVLPQNWLFLSTYKKFREQLLKEHTWHLVARLGEGGFESSAAAGAFVAMLVISRGTRIPSPFMERGLGGEVSGLDVSEYRTAADKAEHLLTEEVKQMKQAKQLENPDARVTLEAENSNIRLLSMYADGLNGMHGGDSMHYRFLFWEIQDLSIWHF
ncbi:MAG: N-6 DNA methylase, partial [Deltaproteobacteria bacterium]|nr:N-6 DNA methylase [Deltaproteobacteria bacterium]